MIDLFLGEGCNKRQFGNAKSKPLTKNVDANALKGQCISIMFSVLKIMGKELLTSIGRLRIWEVPRSNPDRVKPKISN